MKPRVIICPCSQTLGIFNGSLISARSWFSTTTADRQFGTYPGGWEGHSTVGHAVIFLMILGRFLGKNSWSSKTKLLEIRNFKKKFLT